MADDPEAILRARRIAALFADALTWEEGGRCPSCYTGTAQITLDGPCQCATSYPPCFNCTNSFLRCDLCEAEDR